MNDDMMETLDNVFVSSLHLADPVSLLLVFPSDEVPVVGCGGLGFS